MSRKLKTNHSVTSNALKGFQPRALHPAKMTSTELQRQEQHWMWYPIELQQSLSKRAVESLFDEALLQETQYREAWLQCIHFLDDFQQSNKKSYFYPYGINNAFVLAGKIFQKK